MNEGNEAQDLWKIIKSTGCSDIQEAVEGKKSTDFDLSALRWLANFILTSPPDTQAAPKKPLPKSKPPKSPPNKI